MVNVFFFGNKKPIYLWKSGMKINLTSKKCPQPLLLSPLVLQLDMDPLVSKRPLSSLKMNASDQVDVEGGDSILYEN